MASKKEEEEISCKILDVAQIWLQVTQRRLWAVTFPQRSLLFRRNWTFWASMDKTSKLLSIAEYPMEKKKYWDGVCLVDKFRLRRSVNGRLSPQRIPVPAWKIGAPTGHLWESDKCTVNPRTWQVAVNTGNQRSQVHQRLPNPPSVWSLSLDAWRARWLLPVKFPMFLWPSVVILFFSVSWSQLGGLMMGTAGKWFVLQVNSFNCVLKLWVNGVFEALLLLHATAQRLKNWSETWAQIFAWLLTSYGNLGKIINPSQL